MFEKKKMKINDIILTLKKEYKSEIKLILSNLRKQRDDYEEQQRNLAAKVRQREIKLKNDIGMVSESIVSEFEKTSKLNSRTMDQSIVTAESFASEMKNGISNNIEKPGKQSFDDVVRAEKQLTELLQRVKVFVDKKIPTLHTDSFDYEEELDFQRIETLFGRHENDSLYSSDFEEFEKTLTFEVKVENTCTFHGGPVVAICPRVSHILFSIKMTLRKPVYAVFIYDITKRFTELLYQLHPLIVDMAVLKDGRILATKPEEQKVYQLTDDGKLQVFLDTKPMLPYGISVSSHTGDILLALNTENTKGSIHDDRHSVIRLSDGGKVNQNIEFSHDHKKIFKDLFKAVELPNQKICVIDMGVPDLKIVNACGVVETTYNGNNVGDSFCPSDVGCDKNGNIVIADAVGKVHLLSQSGQFIQYLMTEKVPQTIVFDEQNYLWIGCENGEAFQISYKKKNYS